jgi:hypothetical protein
MFSKHSVRMQFNSHPFDLGDILAPNPYDIIFPTHGG